MIYVSKQDMINDLNTKLKDWNDLSEDINGYSMTDAKEFLKRFQVGVYDCGLHGMLWFGPRVNVDLLVSWDSDRRKSKHIFSNISEENLIVYSITLEIKRHLKTIELHPKAYKQNYITNKEGNTQTPATIEELKKYEELFNNVITSNYTWREAREIRKSFKKYNIYENPNFPHEPDLIKSFFKPEIKKFFPDFRPGKCIYYTTNVEEVCQKLLDEDFSKESIQKFMTEKSKTSSEEYVKRQITSIIDFQRIFIKKKNDYNNLKKELKKDSTLSTLGSYILFSNETSPEILNLIKGVLTSLVSEKKPIDLVELCNNFKNILKCNKQMKLVTSDGNIVPPLPDEKREKKFIRFQKKYEFLYKTANDLEYVEGCLELIGDFLTTQLFEKGNKEIAVCLFNTLIISRKLLPPVLDLNEDDYSLMKMFIETYETRYSAAIPVVLKQTVKQTEQFNKNTYSRPTIIT